MNNPFLLACEVAEYRLRDEWNMAALQRAFGEEVEQVMANTWRLCGDTINPELEALYALFDKAGMAKTQQAAAVWKAAQRFYYQQVLAMVNFENQSFRQLSIEEAAEKVAAVALGPGPCAGAGAGPVALRPLAEPEAGAEGTD